MRASSSHQGPVGKLRKSLLISDIDGTIVDMWNAWAQATRRAISRIAYTRRLEVEEVERALAETARTRKISLVDDLGAVLAESPLADQAFDANAERVMQSLGARGEEVDDYILAHWWQDRDRFSVLHEGVEPTLWAARRHGARIILYSDAPITLAARRLWASGFHLDLVDSVYCRQDPPTLTLRGFARPSPGSPEAQFERMLRGRCTLFPATVKKPDLGSMQRILKDADASPGEVVMIGDHAVDVASAKLIPGVTAVWDIDGARVEAPTADQYRRLNQWEHYGIGEDSIRQRMRELGVEPDITLDRRFDQLTRHIYFEPPSSSREQPGRGDAEDLP